MDKLVPQFKLTQQRQNSTVDVLSRQQTRSGKQKYKNHLKWLAFSANSISFLPVFLASEITDSELTRRASSAEILAPVELNKFIRAATSGMPASPFIDPCDSHLTSDPFRATMLWEKIVIHLERTVKSGRHTLGLRTFDNCFHGSKAVDSLVVYLNTILPKTIKRNQAIVLCEKLLETGVIQQVKEKQEFREKGLYRFTHSHFWETPSGSCDSDDHVDSTVQAALQRSRSMDVLEDSRQDLHKPEKQPHLRLPIPKGYASDSTVTLSTRSRKKRRTRKLSTTHKDETISPSLSHRLKRSDFTLLTKNKVQTVARLLQIDRFKVPSKPPLRKVAVPAAPKVHSTRKAKRQSGEPKEIPNIHRRDTHYTTTSIKVHRTTSLTKTDKHDDKPKRRVSQEGYSQLREKENHCQRESIHAVALGACKQESERLKKTKRSSKLRERDLSSQNCGHHLNVANLCTSNGVVILNSATMNRSHSFSSHGDLHERSCVTTDGQARDRSSGVNGKWIVYGFL